MVDDWTEPPRTFDRYYQFDKRIAQLGDISIKGMRTRIGNKNYTVVGRNPNPSNLFRFQIQDENGQYFRVKLALLAYSNPEILEAIKADKVLSDELEQNLLAISKRKAATVKSSETRRSNRRKYD